MQTHKIKAADVNKNWVIVDATDQSVGRLSTEISRVLRGKHKPTFVPHLDCGDHVIVINASKLKFTSDKAEKKFYHWHTGYIGGIKSMRADDMMSQNPDRVLKHAVKGMLPKNKLSRQALGHLKIYKGSEHPHEAQKPAPMAVRLNTKK